MRTPGGRTVLKRRRAPTGRGRAAQPREATAARGERKGVFRAATGDRHRDRSAACGVGGCVRGVGGLSDRTIHARPNRSSFVTRVFLLLIKAYQRVVSPFTPPVCRFYPSCSTYAADAHARHGPWKGGYLAGRRVAGASTPHPRGC